MQNAQPAQVSQLHFRHWEPHRLSSLSVVQKLWQQLASLALHSDFGGCDGLGGHDGGRGGGTGGDGGAGGDGGLGGTCSTGDSGLAQYRSTCAYSSWHAAACCGFSSCTFSSREPGGTRFARSWPRSTARVSPRSSSAYSAPLKAYSSTCPACMCSARRPSRGVRAALSHAAHSTSRHCDERTLVPMCSMLSM